MLSLIQAVPGFPGCVQRALKTLGLSSLVPCPKSPGALRLRLRLRIKSNAIAGCHRCSYVTHRLKEGSSYPGTREVLQPGSFSPSQFVMFTHHFGDCSPRRNQSFGSCDQRHITEVFCPVLPSVCKMNGSLWHLKPRHDMTMREALPSLGLLGGSSLTPPQS